MNTELKKNEIKRRGISVLLRAMRYVTHNWPWKLLAVFLAVCLWAGLISQDTTLIRERIFTDVPLNVINVDQLRRNSGLVVVSGLEPENLNVRMHVEVPQREYSTVAYTNYNPRIDLTRITGVGEQTLKVTTTSTAAYGSVVDISPSTVNVVVDEYVTNYRVPVSVNTIGDYPSGFYGGTISVDPSVAAVSGPKSIVDQVSRIVVDYDVSRLSARAGAIRSARALRFVDRDGNVVESDMLEVTSADVVLRTAIVSQTLYPTASVELSGDDLITGTPAKGYRVRSVSVSPDRIRAAGAEDVLATLDSLFAAEPVDVTGKTETFSQTIRIRKPAEVEHLSSTTAEVTVELEPVLVSRSFDNVKLQVRGTDSSLKATPDVKSISLVLTGPQLKVEAMRSSKLSAWADATGLKAGEHVLPVQLHAEDTDLTDVTFLATPAVVTVTLAEN